MGSNLIKSKEIVNLMFSTKYPVLPSRAETKTPRSLGMWRFFCFFLLALGLSSPAGAVTLDTEQIAQKLAESLKSVATGKYATIAFSRIQGNLDLETKNELIDFTNVAIVRSRTFRVIDRSKLNLIIEEQKFNLSGMVTQDTYKELGKLLGVDLFVYGRFYNDVLVMKAIDVERSIIVWAEIIQTAPLDPQTLALSQLSEVFTSSISKDIKRLNAEKINQISFWNINSRFNSELTVDFLSASLTKAGLLRVVDRDNLSLILEEQKLSMSDFIDQNKAKKMGELYGVDAFIYGSITQKKGQWVASLKMLNIYTGEMQWADLLRFGGEPEEDKRRQSAVGPAENGMVQIGAGEFIMGNNEGDLIYTPILRNRTGSYFIDKTEVSNRDYLSYINRFSHRAPPHWSGGRYPVGKDDQPVVNVNWQDAHRFCQTSGKRLPTESEWEKAYRGSNGNIYPWPGDQFERNAARTVESGVQDPVSVYEPESDISTYGVMHLAGNVREWVDSDLVAYPGSNYRVSAREKVIRGGSWAKSKVDARGYIRHHSDPKYGWQDVGFRCAKDAN